ncbi:MAG: MBL fold metallo-hydrolase [Parasphingorhabdus sp.]
MRLLLTCATLSLTLSACLENGTTKLADPKACKTNDLAVQVLGSGGPIADDDRAGSGNVVWIDGKARVIVDAGPGAFIRHAEAGIDFNDLYAILLTHFHGDHAGGLPGLLNSGSFSGRKEPFIVAGPDGSEALPSTSDFLEALIGKQGAFPYLSSYLDDSDPLPQITVRNIVTSRGYLQAVNRFHNVDIDAIGVHHLEVPALAFVVRNKGKRLLFSGDQSFLSEAFVEATRNGRPDLMFMHNAISMADGQPRGLHRDGVSIGEAAASAGAKKLILTHHMQRALDDKDAILAAIRESFDGPIEFADDLSCYPVIK